jgi:hypothetical protein
MIMTPMPEMVPAVAPRLETGLTVPSRVNDSDWSLAMALAWIAYRSETAVSTVKSGRWVPTEASIRDLLSALRAGRLVAHGLFEGERIPHPIETAVWANFEIVVKPMRFVGHPALMLIVIAQGMGAPHTRLLDVVVPAAKVRRLWPLGGRTAAAETRCQAYLVTAMTRSPERQPKPKREILADCRARFGVSERSFERAWANAKALTGTGGWGRPGRPSRSSHSGDPIQL